jgi:predicted  nucleic acid-binding Zn-ribbon protein
LREQEKERREIEKDINRLEKERTALRQKIEHENREAERTEKSWQRKKTG